MNKEQEMVRIACKAIDDKKAIDIKVIDIHEVSVIADYFIIASGNNLNQVQAIVDNVEESMFSMKKTVFSMIWNESGEMEKNWMLLIF